MTDVEWKVVVITGASAGVGRATVRELARPGVKMALLARGTDGLEGARRDAEACGAEALTFVLDVADADAVELAAAETERRLGPIDLWINNAMVTVLAPIRETSPADFERVTAVTYLGSVYGTMAALKRMLPRDRGTILQVGSALSYRGIPLQAAYCGAKFALRGFIDSLRCELIHDHSNVHVTMVHMPALNTPQFEWCRTVMPRHPQPVPPIFQPEVAARAIREAARMRRREIWVGSSTVKTVLGSRFASRFLDHYLATKGYDGQQTDDLPMPADRRDNLYRPVPGDHGAHGAFDARALETSKESELRRGVERMVGALPADGADGGARDRGASRRL